MPPDPEKPPVSAYQGPGAAASMNGKQSHPASHDLASEVLRESTLTLAAVERIADQLELVNVELALLIGLTLVTLALVAITTKRGQG